ncbi:hypothetical protein BGX23_007574 [Mortierella sp. AD031]|nr:hypothetical protein BGX23_007574 [Mortierella sp. AD031]KAG0198676.1 hypothetical protein BGX33_012163 [Mortierella sp. NVP41]
MNYQRWCQRLIGSFWICLTGSFILNEHTLSSMVGENRENGGFYVPSLGGPTNRGVDSWL